MTALSAAGIPVVAGLAPRSVYAAYDPAAKFDLKVSEVEFRRNAAGRMLMARIYQPQGAGPFRRCSICTAARGTTRTAVRRSRWTARCRERVLVVAIDMTLARRRRTRPACRTRTTACAG